MPSAVEDPAAHQNCPWCHDNEELKVVLHDSPADNFAVWCSACGCFGPTATDRAEAWDLWDER
jgi:hypothetical protein